MPRARKQPAHEPEVLEAFDDEEMGPSEEERLAEVDEACREAIDAIRALCQPRSEINWQITGIVNEAVEQGANGKALRQVVRLLQMDRKDREDLDYYVKRYLGLVEDAPDAAAGR